MSLRPIPLASLLRRLVRELESAGDDGMVFELPSRRIYRGARAGLDLAVHHHGGRAANPLGPAAGPHTQLAQNIVAGWLAGCRIFELKTVQVKDDLVIPRPCIDMATVGYNVEWSQELRLEASAREYAKAWFLVAALREGGLAGVAPGHGDTLFDTSVGYDLAGIRSPSVSRFLDAMVDASAHLDALRAEVPSELARLRDVPVSPVISRSVTLSTFHGCPPSEIEAIAAHLMRDRGLDVVVKVNPTLLGRARVDEILHGALGYDEVRVPASAFERDASWEQMTGIVGRLDELARGLGRGFGVKLTNTLVVENHRDFFPKTEREMYLSGAPLHVLALDLLARFREAFGANLSVSFSAGIDKKNFPDAVACGLVPVTVCSDLLQPGGYARAHGYLGELEARMVAASASDLPGFIRTAYEADGTGDVVKNARRHAAAVLADPRYAKAKNSRPPRKLDRHLARFDCTACDKCLPVCPNLAIFAFDAPGDGRTADHQIGIFADACNDCGNCDVFCPEHGGPNLAKPRFHGSLEGYLAAAPRDGVYVERTADGFRAWGRLGGVERIVDQTGTAPATATSLNDEGDDALRTLRALAVGALTSRQESWVR